MVTDSTNVVYVCAACGQPARISPMWDQWEHYSRTSRCSQLTVREVRLPVPSRETA